MTQTTNEPILDAVTTLKELKNKATAAELTLIEAVEKAAEAQAAETVLRRATDFLRGNPLPYRDHHGGLEALQLYVNHMVVAIRGEDSKTPTPAKP